MQYVLSLISVGKSVFPCSHSQGVQSYTDSLSLSLGVLQAFMACGRLLCYIKQVKEVSWKNPLKEVFEDIFRHTFEGTKIWKGVQGK